MTRKLSAWVKCTKCGIRMRWTHVNKLRRKDAEEDDCPECGQGKMVDD